MLDSMQPADNIADVQQSSPTTAPQAVQSTSTLAPTSIPTYNVYTARAEIIKYYDRQFKKLLFVVPSQVIDGSAAEFYDDEMKITVATCRIRFRNQYSVDTKTGDLALSVELSDLSFKPLILNVSAVHGVK